jgi:hypothetical protein
VWLLLTFQAVSATDEAALLDLTARLPGAEMPLREHYPTAVAWQAACDTHAQLWHAWRTASPAQPLEAYRAACAHATHLRRTLAAERRELTIAVGLVSRSERLPARIVKGLRACEVWRFTPGKPAPLEAWLAKSREKHARLVRQGKHAEAAHLEAVRQWVQTLIAQWSAALKARRQERRPWGWQWIWIAPDCKTTHDDFDFQLRLHLLREQMVEDTSQMRLALDRYMRQFRSKTEEARQAALLGVWQRHALPEDPGALRKYIAATIQGEDATLERTQRTPGSPSSLSPEEADALRAAKTLGKPQQQAMRLAGDAQEFRVDTLERLLASEAPHGQWTPSRDTLYDWITTGHRWYGPLPARRQGKALYVPAAGLELLRTIVRDENRYRHLWEEGRQRGISEANLKKLFQRLRSQETQPGAKQPLPDWEAIAAHIQSRGTCAGTQECSGPHAEAEEALFHEDQIAAVEECLATAELGSAAWIAAWDALQRLRHRQQDGPP